MDSLRSEFTAVERRWVKLRGEAEKWGKMLERIHPEMETFQVSIIICNVALDSSYGKKLYCEHARYIMICMT